jgi:hypothetical protein
MRSSRAGKLQAATGLVATLLSSSQPASAQTITEFPVPAVNGFPNGITAGAGRRSVVHRCRRKRKKHWAHHDHRSDYRISDFGQ